MSTDLILSSPETDASPDLQFDLGQWLGRHQALGAMSAKASAADVECLRQIRDQKLYKCKTTDFGEFCNQYVGASKAQVNRLIGYLEKYGPPFFAVTQLTRIPAAAYEAISSSVTEAGVALDGETIPLSQENSERISAAVAELRKRAGCDRSSTPPPKSTSYAEVDKVLVKAVADLEALDRQLDGDECHSLTMNLLHLRRAAMKFGVIILK
jgi:hypothetical protein